MKKNHDGQEGGGGATSYGKSHKFYTSLEPYHYHNYILWLSSSSSSLQPYLEVLGQFILPAEEIVVTVVLGVLDPVCTVL